MLYIYLIPPGRILTFDINYAFQQFIFKFYGIPIAKQVFFLSRGISIPDNAKISAFSGGTDSNPVFLINKLWLEKSDYRAFLDIAELEDITILIQRVTKALHIEPTFNALTIRTQLSQSLEETSRKYLQECQALVNAQHLLQQAWATVLANLHDILYNYKKRCYAFSKFQETTTPKVIDIGMEICFENEKLKHRNNIKNCKTSNSRVCQRTNQIFYHTLLLLDELPSNTFKNFIDNYNFNEPFENIGRKIINETRLAANINISALDWCDKHISLILPSTPCFIYEYEKTDLNNENFMDYQKMLYLNSKAFNLIKFFKASPLLTEYYKKDDIESLNQFVGFNNFSFQKNYFYSNFKMDNDKLHKLTNKNKMKQIGGLENRLLGLENILITMSKIYQDQSHLARGILQNQIHAAEENDVTILPDLCSSHNKQLNLMLQHLRLMRGLTLKCVNSKREMVSNVRIRLKWLTRVQKLICILDAKMGIILRLQRIQSQPNQMMIDLIDLLNYIKLIKEKNAY